MSAFSSLSREARFLFKQRSILALFCIAFVLSTFAVWSGMSESTSQVTTIKRLLEKDRIDRESILAKQTDYGSAAYYSFHLTYSPPSDVAFAAMGQRDIYPWKHRVRMLAIEGQIYETDAANPELSFLGRFDFAFLVSVLLPLFIILLLHDIRAAERGAGRYDLLVTSASKARNLWLSRATVLCLALLVSVILPFTIGAVLNQAPLVSVLQIIAVVVAHLTIWAVAILWFTSTERAEKQNSAQIASILLSAWLVVTVLIPAGSDLVIDELVHSPNGGEIVLTQREAVNDAWDLPFSETWDAFLATHPQWQDKTQMDSMFEWKWYYAFQQVGDQQAQSLAREYRDATIQKHKLATRLALLSPPMLTQNVLASIARTDTIAALKYEQRVRDYHAALRHFYYPLMFNKQEFKLEAMSELPQFSDYVGPTNNIK